MRMIRRTRQHAQIQRASMDPGVRWIDVAEWTTETERRSAVPFRDQRFLMHRCRSLSFVTCCTCAWFWLSLFGSADEPVRSADTQGAMRSIPGDYDGTPVPPQLQAADGVQLTLIAQHPQVVTPTGIDVDAQGRVFVVSSHTHFRPDDYVGPKHDEVIVLSADGRQRSVFYNKTTATMDLELGRDGWVYLAERDRILRVRDTDADGIGDEEQDVAVLQTEEDYQFINAVDSIVKPAGGFGAANAGNPAAGAYGTGNSAVTGQAQYGVINAAASHFSREEYVNVLNMLEDQSLNNGVVLMNRKTAKTFLTFDRSEVGGDLSQTLFTDGLTGLQEAKIFGVKHLFTIKRDIVPDNTIYLFAEPEYLGRFYTLQDPTMYVEKKKDILRFSARETLSVTFANLVGVGRIDIA